jgi:hypothetical protein
MITANSTYTELKKWFTDENGKVKADLPTTLNSDCAYYFDVPATTKMYITNVDSELKRLGSKNIGKSADAKASKLNLYRLYKSLQVKENWNAGKPRREDIFKKN